MDIIKILNKKELRDIPLLYVIRVITSIQEDIIDEQSSKLCEKIQESNK